MSENINVGLGSFVISKSGRDKMRPFIVIGIKDDNYVLIADGDLRKADSPKLKKLKHLNVSKVKAEEIESILNAAGKVTDIQLKKAIADFSFGHMA